jgi:tetratricopeptide (TPR) repeat protein
MATIASDALRLAGKKASLSGRRVGVLHPDPGGADALAETLRMRGAQVAVLSLDPALLARAEALDPEVIVTDPRHFTGAGWATAAAVFKHPQLRWACLLLSAPEVLPGSGLESHDVPGLCAQIQLLCAEYDAAVARARVPPLFEVALEAVGPARALRVLVQSGLSWRARFTTRSLVLEVDTSDGLVVGARGGQVGATGDELLGTAALNVLLREDQGVVHAEIVERPAVTNIMCPLDTALAGASHGRDVRESSRPRAAQGLPAPAAVLNASRGVRPRTLMGVGTALPPAARRASLPQEPVSWRDATLLAGLAPPPSNDQAEAAPAQTPAAAPPQPPASVPLAVTPYEDFDDKTASGAFDTAAHEQAFLAVARAEAERTRALDQVLSNRPEATSYTPPVKRSTRYLKPLVFVAGAAVLTLVTVTFSRRADDVHSAPLQTTALTSSAPPNNTSAPTPGVAAPTNVVTPAPAAIVPAEPAPSAEPTPNAAPAADVLAAPAQPLPATQAADDGEEDDESADEPADNAASSDEEARAKALARQGKALLKKGRTSQAKETFEAALAIVPNHTRALSALTKLSLKEHDAVAALKYASALAKLRPKSGSALLMLGDAQQLSGDTTSATESWQRAAQRGSKPAKARLTNH